MMRRYVRRTKCETPGLVQPGRSELGTIIERMRRRRLCRKRRKTNSDELPAKGVYGVVQGMLQRVKFFDLG